MRPGPILHNQYHGCWSPGDASNSVPDWWLIYLTFYLRLQILGSSDVTFKSSLKQCTQLVLNFILLQVATHRRFPLNEFTVTGQSYSSASEVTMRNMGEYIVRVQKELVILPQQNKGAYNVWHMLCHKLFINWHFMEIGASFHKNIQGLPLPFSRGL